MDIDDLKIFVDLIAQQSFSKCAELNFLTQPAISQKIKRLENNFAARLINKKPHKIVLSPAGRLLYQTSKKILAEQRRLRSGLSSLSRTVQGAINVAAVYSIGIYELDQIVKNFINKFPEVQLKMEFSHFQQIYQDLIEGRIDVGFVAYPRAKPRLKIIPYKRDPLMLVVPPHHPLARYQTLDIRQITGAEFIGFNQGIPTQQAINKIFHQYQIKVKTRMEFDNIELIKAAVKNGLGISLLPSLTIRQEEKHGLLKKILFKNQLFWRPLAMVVRQERHSAPALDKFIAEAKA